MKYITVRSIATMLVALTIVVGTAVNATDHSSKSESIDEEALTRRITEQVMRELQKDEYLQRQIERGIENYIRKQKRAQAQAKNQRAREANERAKSVRRVSASRDHIRGNRDAELSLIEYSDFECPYCKRFHPTANKVLEAYEGRVNWVYRHFPLGFHNPSAQKQAEASECAAELGGNDAFWAYTDALYERTRSGGKGFPMNGLVPLGGELGLDTDAFRQCLKSERHAARVKEDFSEGARSGISGTPGHVLLNNKTGEVRLRAGAVPYAALKAEIDRMLADK